MPARRAKASWECRRQIEGERPSACRDRSYPARPRPGDEILLDNRNSGLPIDNECEKAETGQQFGHRPLTRSDDRSFRLTRMPIRPMPAMIGLTDPLQEPCP